MGSFAVLPLGELVELLARLREDRHPLLRARDRPQDRQPQGAARRWPPPPTTRASTSASSSSTTATSPRSSSPRPSRSRRRPRSGSARCSPWSAWSPPTSSARCWPSRSARPCSTCSSGTRASSPSTTGRSRRVDELDARVPLAEVVREAEFRATAWSAFRGEFPSGAAALPVVEEKVPPDLGPATVDGRLLALAREGKTIDEIGLILHATDFHLYQRLYALARQGWLRGAAAPAPPRPGRRRRPTELVDRARGLLADGNADEAELAAARAVELAPGLGGGPRGPRRRGARAGRSGCGPSCSTSPPRRPGCSCPAPSWRSSASLPRTATCCPAATAAAACGDLARLAPCASSTCSRRCAASRTRGSSD